MIFIYTIYKKKSLKVCLIIIKIKLKILKNNFTKLIITNKLAYKCKMFCSKNNFLVSAVKHVCNCL